MVEHKAITWQSTKAELNVCRQTNGNIDYDKYRRSKLAAVEKHTNIPLVAYATDFLSAEKFRSCQGQVDIDLTDLQGFQEVTRDLPDGPLDVLLHSPGGSAEAGESIVKVIRQRFSPVRFIIPVIAKSAATMLALSGDEILMPPSAELGPIDPQFRLSDGAGGIVMTPAQVLIDQFRQAQEEIIANQALAAAWAPIMQRYGVGLYQKSLNAIELSKDLVKQYLMSYMFKDLADAGKVASGIVDFLGNHNAFKSHARRVDLEELQKRGVIANDIRTTDAVLWQLVEEAWYAIQHTFEGTTVFKLFENSRGRGFFRMVMVQVTGQSLPVAPKDT
ncbi:MAG: serine protease [Thermodesulfobacteriota bacterium]